MKNISTSKKIILYLVVLNLLFIGVYVFAFLSVRSINQEASLLSFEIDFFEERKRAFVELEESFEVAASEADKLEEYFIQPDEIAVYFEDIENLALQTGVNFNLSSVDTVNLREYEGVEVLQLTIDARGNWDQIFNFTSLLEAIPYQTNTSRLSLELVSLGQSSENQFLARQAVWRSSMDIAVLKFQ